MWEFMDQLADQVYIVITQALVLRQQERRVAGLLGARECTSFDMIIIRPVIHFYQVKGMYS